MNVETVIRRLYAEVIAERREDELIEKLETAAQGVGAIRYDKDGSTTNAPDRNEIATIKLAEVRSRINKLRVERAAFRSEVSGRFYNLLDAYPAYLLDLHYIRGMTFRQIGELTGRAPGTICDNVQHAKRELAAIYRRFGEDVEI